MVDRGRPAIRHLGRGHADERSARDVGLHIGVPPRRIDILTVISGIAFAEAWPRRQATTLGEVPCAVIGLEDLITNKRASARPKTSATSMR